MMDTFDPAPGVEKTCIPSSEADVVELPILLPGWQVMRLETVAHQRGMTAAAMVRNLLRDFLAVAPTQKRSPAS